MGGTGSYVTPAEGGPPHETAYWLLAHLLTQVAPSSGPQPVQLFAPFDRQPQPVPESNVQSTNLAADRHAPMGAEFEFLGTLHAPPLPVPLLPPEPLEPASSSAAPASEASGAYVSCGPLQAGAAMQTKSRTPMRMLGA